MRQRQFGIEGQRLLGIFLGDGIKFLPQKHARREEIARRRIRRHLKHAGERLARLRVVLGLDVAQAQNIGSIHIGPRIPCLDSFEQRNGFGRPSRKVVGKAQQLDCFFILWILRQGPLEGVDGFDVLAFLVISRA